MTKTTPHAVLSICCRPLVEAFRRELEATSDAGLVGYFDESGAPFYRFARMHGGQIMSAPAEPLVFCPFCGHKVVGAGEPRASALAADLYDGEASPLALDETLELEIETLIAARVRALSDEHTASL